MFVLLAGSWLAFPPGNRAEAQKGEPTSTRAMALRHVVAVDENTAWAAGSPSFMTNACWIIKTVDGGRNWMVQAFGPTGFLQTIEAADADTAWAGGLFGVVLNTTDAGRSWEVQDAGFTDSGMVRGMCAVDSRTAWAVGAAEGAEGVIMHTVDGGATWKPQAFPGFEVRDIDSTGPMVAWAVGDSGSILYTDDGGETWTPQVSGTGYAINSVSVTDENTAWAADKNHNIYRTVDGGENWTVVNNLSGGALKEAKADRRAHKRPSGTMSISALDADNAWAVSVPGLVHRTTDGGATWTQVYSGAFLYSVSALDVDNAWAVGDPAILRTRDGGETWETQEVTNPPSNNWYLAEGSTAAPFETWVVVQNPGDTEADISLAFQTPDGTVDGPQDKLAAGSRRTYNVADYVPAEDSVSTTVKSSIPVVAERAVYWDGRTGGHASIGTSVPAANWFLAEGSTAAPFETWVVVQNPGNTEALVELTFQTSDGEVRGPRRTVEAGTRETFNVADTLPGVESVSTTVRTDEPDQLVVAERAMYWNDRTAGHDSIGVPVPATEWYLAEGSTGGTFETWVVVQNPGDTEALVELTFQTPEGEITGPTQIVPPEGRHTFELKALIPGVDSVSTRVTSDGAVVAERAMYWNNRTGGHASLGASSMR